MITRYNSCQICGTKNGIFSHYLGLCPDCIERKPDKAIKLSRNIHSYSRTKWGLPPAIPQAVNGKICQICANKCSIALDKVGYCGLWKNTNGKLISIIKPNEAKLHTYLDALPTNCCNMYFCPGGTKTGYPKYSYTEGAEYGFYNLACFFYGCNFSCLGCQNDQHRAIQSAEVMNLDIFLHNIKKNERISCICWFGGSAEPQLPFALRASRLATQMDKSRILRVCFEWNGAGNEKLVAKATELALKTGGNIKYDLKYFNSNLSIVLSGVPNTQSYSNFRKSFDKYYSDRPENPLLSATTLLVPGYVNSKEVEHIAQFIASLDKEIPYSLLIFHPQSYLRDLPITPRKEAMECLAVAKKHLNNVHLGNKHLLL